MKKKTREIVTMLKKKKVVRYAVNVLDTGRHVLVLNEEIVTAWHILHYVSLDLLIFQDGQAVVDQDGRRSGLKVGPEIGRRLEHVHCRHFQADRLQLGQQVQVHKVLLTEETGAFTASINRRRLWIDKKKTKKKHYIIW